MAAVKHSNFFSTTLATPPTGTTEAAFTVTSATNLPTLAAGDWCYVVLKNASLTREVIKIGTISGVTLTPAVGGRGADGSAAYASWMAGDVIELCIVNASLLDLLYGFKDAFYNTAKTFKSVFANANTAARTYTFSDRDGNVITDADVVAAAAVTPADANVMPVIVGGVLKNATWANIKATFKTYFDTLYASLAGATFTGGINEARGSVAMHATTMDLWAQPNIIDGTGSAVTITAIVNAPQAGARRVLYPITGTTITNGATFAVDGAANYTTAAGDKLEFESITTSTYKVHITKKNGTAVANTFSSAAENIAGTIENKSVDPLGIREAFNSTGTAPVYACRAWANFDGTGAIGVNQTILGSGNVASVYKNGTGDYTVTFATAMPDANYAVTLGGGYSGATDNSMKLAAAPLAGSFRIVNIGSSAADSAYQTAAVFR